MVHRWLSGVVAGALITGLAGCAQAPLPSGTNDPYEVTNRYWFERDMALSAALTPADMRPSAPTTAAGGDASGGQDDPQDASQDATPAVAPPSHPFRRTLANFGGNLGLPSTILNDLLQIRPDHAAENTIRLVINSTIGLGGLFDPAGRMGIHGRPSDFGETLHRWGAAEGAYMVLPLYGPSTERDAAGLVVDTLIDPLRFVLPRREWSWSQVVRFAGDMAYAAEYSDLLDANVINTADPYAQARILYLQRRRYHLGIEAEDQIIDPYAEF